jgi:FdhD protein
MSSVRPVQVKKFGSEPPHSQPDLVATEEPLEIRLGYGPEHLREQRSLAVTMRSPGHDLELALGFLFTEGIIQHMEEVLSVRHCENTEDSEKDNVVRAELHPTVNLDWAKLQRNFYTSSSCGVCGKSSIESVQVRCGQVEDDGWRVAAALLGTLSAKLLERQAGFAHTGGVHASGWFDAQGDLVLLREDVGRHNALDKVVGAALSQGMLPMNRSLVMVSGRASFELVQKAARAGIPLIVAVGAPSSLAIDLAHSLGITLVGFLRGTRFNVYTHAQRILDKAD